MDIDIDLKSLGDEQLKAVRDWALRAVHLSEDLITVASEETIPAAISIQGKKESFLLSPDFFILDSNYRSLAEGIRLEFLQRKRKVAALALA